MNVMNGDSEKTKGQAFGPWLRGQRERSGKARKAVAASIGIHTVQLARIETGESGTRRETLDALIAELSLDPKEAYIKAGFMPPEDGAEIDLRAQANRAAELIRDFLSLTPEQQAQAIAVIKILQSNHPELLKNAPITIINAYDLTESDAEESPP